MAILGIPRLRQQLQQIPKAVHSGLVRAIATSALSLDKSMKEMIQRGPKTGRVYKRGNVLHRASAPGEPPASDTGRLASSISPQFHDNGLRATIGVHEVSRVRYATFLEFGTRRMLPRPFVRPAFTLKKDEIKARLHRAVESGLRRKAG